MRSQEPRPFQLSKSCMRHCQAFPRYMSSSSLNTFHWYMYLLVCLTICLSVLYVHLGQSVPLFLHSYYASLSSCLSSVVMTTTAPSFSENNQSFELWFMILEPRFQAIDKNLSLTPKEKQRRKSIQHFPEEKWNSNSFHRRHLSRRKKVQDARQTVN